MKRFAFLLLAYWLLTSDMASSRKLPSYVPSCETDSEDLSRCIANAWEALRPKVGEGIPYLKIPPLEPFLLPRMSMDKTSDTLDFKIIMTQITIMGLTKVIVSKLNVDLSDLSGSMSLTFADLNMTTLYDVDAMMMKLVRMRGQGQFNGTISDLIANLTGKAELSPKNKHGKSYLKLVQLKIKLNMGNAVGLMVDNSNNPQNEFFTEMANEFYDKNKRKALDILTPSIEEFCESLVLQMANQVLSVVPFEEMFVTPPKEPRWNLI